jgi:hypothetical protein
VRLVPAFWVLELIVWVSVGTIVGTILASDFVSLVWGTPATAEVIYTPTPIPKPTPTYVPTATIMPTATLVPTPRPTISTSPQPQAAASAFTLRRS